MIKSRTLWRAALAVIALAVLVSLPVQAQQLRVQKYLVLKREGKVEEALALAREEIASPYLRSSGYLADVYVIGIGALGDYVQRFGVKPGIDEEAERYYREALKQGENDEARIGNIKTVYARYFSDTGRNGLAMARYRENLEFWNKQNKPFMMVVSLDALAAGNNDMGELAISDHYRGLALAAAADFFGSSSNKPTANEWLQYSTILRKAMDAAARRRAVHELDRLWPIKRDISERYLKFKSSAYLTAADHYAVAGALARAQELLAKGRELVALDQRDAREDQKTALEADVDRTVATVNFFSGRYREAVDGFEAVLKVRTLAGIRAEDMALHRFRGRAYEKTGELEKAEEAFNRSIRTAEGLRQSYAVAERAAFFRSVVKESYHGLIRVTARRAAAERSIEPFWAAVQASEMVRARQLGDLIDPGAPPLVTREALEALRAGLGSARAILYFTVAGDDLVILALTAERQLAVLQPIEASFVNSVRQLARDLSRPETPVARIEAALQLLGKTVLSPVAEILQSRAELIVLPDGVLNLIPFDLLSVDPAGYRPLAQTHQVRLAPSLRFAGRTQQAPRVRGLLAVADPKYQQPAAIAGIERATIEAATRNSRYLDYFKPLPETRTEAQAIGQLFGGGTVQTLFGETATESAVKRLSFGAFSHLHFATHGILGEEVPGIGEPALVLAAEPSEDGFLTASEIAALKIDADLAVLSACNTGSGEYVTGEGVMGLSRAFLIAGSRAVVVSLWPVASQATERLMVMFYTNLRTGQDAHEALRAAKIKFRDDAIRANSIERHPMFWAPFVVFGS